MPLLRSGKLIRHALISLSVLIVVIFLSSLYIWQIEKRHSLELRNTLYEIAANHAYSIQRQLSQSLSATYTLAVLIRLHGRVQEFDELSEHIIATYGGISAVSIAPRGIVRQIYPFKGNEKAIGHNLLKDPARRTEAMKAIQSRALTLAGPVQLIQGGTAVIGRLPVFTVQDGKDNFWGFAIVLIHLSKLLGETNIKTLVDKGYGYELARIDPDTGKRAVFYRSGSGTLDAPVSYAFGVPNGEWTLSVSPQKGWQLRPQVFMSSVIAVVIGLSFAMLTFILLRRSEEIQIKSRALEVSNRELQRSLEEVKRLSGLLPICSNCKKIRDDQGYWQQIEAYIREHSEAEFTHSICPECKQELYPEFQRRKE